MIFPAIILVGFLLKFNEKVDILKILRSYFRLFSELGLICIKDKKLKLWHMTRMHSMNSAY